MTSGSNGVGVLVKLLVLTVAMAAGCSDDGGSAADRGTAAEIGGLDGLAGDGPAADGPVPDGPLPDGPVPDGDATPPPSDGSGGSFDLEVTIGFSFIVTCDAADSDKDCEGDLYLSVHDKPVSATSFGTPIHEKLVKNVAKGTVVKATSVPLAPKLYLAAFLDDNDNVDPTQVGPDKGDPVFLDQAPFPATPGATVKRKLDFQIRLP